MLFATAVCIMRVVDPYFLEGGVCENSVCLFETLLKNWETGSLGSRGIELMAPVGFKLYKG